MFNRFTKRPNNYAVAVPAIMGFLFLLGVLLGGRARTAAPGLLLGVVIIALAWGTMPALLAAACATLAYTYFLLQPVGFAVEDPGDWLAFGTFTITAIVIGELAARAEKRHLEAQQGRQEIEHLYKQLETAFERASEAEAARRSEQLKTALLDALRHNLRTPLTSIKASVTALLGQGGWHASAITSEGRVELLQIIDEETDRLNRFIEGLAAADRASGPAPMSLGPVRLSDIVRAGLSRAEPLVRDHRVTVSIPSDLPPVAVDPSAITEVVYILVDNATKYSPPGTEIRILAGQDGQRHVCVEVIDEGPGIPPALRERVFENFFRIQGRDPEDPHRVGIGLGLPIARRLVEAQTGRIWIETPTSRRGTAVILMLPLSMEAGERVEQPAASVAGR